MITDIQHAPTYVCRLRAEYRATIIHLLTRGPVYRYEGICGNLGLAWVAATSCRTQTPHLLVALAARRLWPRCSESYPIPGGRKAYDYGQRHGTLWQGKQLAYRQQLLREMLRILAEEEAQNS